MGPASDQIEREIASTREHLDENLGVLERRAVSGARRAAMLAAIGVAGGVVIAGVAYLVYRRVRKPAIATKKTDEEPGVWQAIGRKVVPALISTAASAVMAQAVRRLQRQP
jgi:hypothetical protein